jgi:uncharacterized membrane protein YfcA
MTTLKEWGLFTIISVIAGFMNGALGLGAGIALSALLVPFGLVKDYKTAIGTTILAILPPLALPALHFYWEKKQVNVRAAIILMVLITISSYFGGLFTSMAKPQVIAGISSTIFAGFSIFWAYCAYTGKYLK